jgi:ferredoxin
LTLRRLLLRVLTTAFRFFPWPTRPGLRAVGEPGRDSPVILTCNFALTVDRVTRTLAGLDVWLLVADSRGINVWCAAAGGHLNTHDAISAIKTTGVAQRVVHRTLILPQLAATGIEPDKLEERTGWKTVWGPVYIEDLPSFLRGEGLAKMHDIRFPLRQRLEMAVMWAAPLSLLAMVTLLVWPRGFVPLLAMAWGLTLAVYGVFPLYGRLLRPRGFARISVLFGCLTVGGVALVGMLAGSLSPSFMLRWGGLGLATVLLLTSDLPGCTPLLKSRSHEECGYAVELDKALCISCGRCAEVCPRGVFVVAGAVSMPGASRCVLCGACVVQCPTDALAFVAPAGARVPPEDIRRYKLSLLGRRRAPSDISECTPW